MSTKEKPFASKRGCAGSESEARKVGGAENMGFWGRVCGLGSEPEGTVEARK